MIPLRTNIERHEADDIFEIKQEIESAPPEFLNEDKRLEQPSSSNNNMQDQSNQVGSYAQELASGENLKKYNILIQNSQLDIVNPHMVNNGFLNENDVMQNIGGDKEQTCKVRGLPYQQNLLENNLNFLDLMSTSLHASSEMNFWPNELNDENGMSIEQQSMIQSASQNFRVLKYNRRQNDARVTNENDGVPCNGGGCDLSDVDADSILAPIQAKA